MADITVRVLQPADNFDLVTLDELKTMLGIATDNTSDDAQFAMWITQYSDLIATMCNRVFAKEKVEETWRGELAPFDTEHGRVYLTHYPVADDDLELAYSNGVLIDPVSYELENRTGKLQFFGGGWSEPLRVTYTGGYDLPDEAPPALKQAMSILIGASRTQAQQQLTSGIRSVSHRESRVQFFDPNAAANRGSQGQGGGGALANAISTIEPLLYKYMRFYV